MTRSPYAILPRPAYGLLMAAFIGTTWACPHVHAQGRINFEVLRPKMVQDYIEGEGIRSPRVLEAMRTVPRHEFVPIPLRANSYEDLALPIGYKQTISPPFVVAYMTETIDPQPTDKILEIGTGSGYQAAVLGELAKEVYSIEIVDSLGRAAKRRLQRLGYDNVTTKVGDGYLGWAEHAPFDKIIVTCSPESVPRPLVDQLREGGRMIVPIGQRYQQVFYLFEKRDGELVSRKLISTLFVPMTGRSEEQRQVLPDPLTPHIVNGDFSTDENADGLPDSWHYQRRTRWEATGGPDGSPCIVFQNEEPGRMCQALQGMAIDGRKIGAVRLSVKAESQDVRNGTERHERPALGLHFYDSLRRPIGEFFMGRWSGTSGWDQESMVVKIPPETREAIVRIGLNGGTGTLRLDDVELEPILK